MRALLLIALPVLYTTARAQETVYDLSFLAGDEQVTGTMTLSGGINGPVSASNIAAYDFGSALGSPVYFNAIDSRSDCMSVGCGLVVAGNDLIWNPPYVPQGTINLAGISGVTLYDGDGGPGLKGETSIVDFLGPGGGPQGCFSCGGQLFVTGNIDPTKNDGGGDFASLSLSFGEVLGTAVQSGSMAEQSVPVPEIDSGGAAAGCELLAGVLAMLLGRRRVLT